MEREIWIALCAHRLQRQWRTVDPAQLDEVAGDLWNDERLRQLAPADAAADWLRPVTCPPTAASASRRNDYFGSD